jgi:hypothetical protein
MSAKEPMRRILFFPVSQEDRIMALFSEFVEQNKIRCDFQVTVGAGEWRMLRARAYPQAMRRLDDWATGFAACGELS